MADRYWVGGTGTWDTTSTTNWSATSGGASGASAPTAADNVFFNANSNVGTGSFIVTIGAANVSCLNFTASGLDGPMTLSFIANSRYILVFGNWSNPATNFGIIASASANAGLSFQPAVGTTKTITTNSVSIPSPLVIEFLTAATFQLASALTHAGAVTFFAGTLNLNNFTFTTGIFNSSTSTTRSIAFGTANIVLNSNTASTTVLAMATATNFTWTGTGGFVRNQRATAAFTFGSTAGGSVSNAPNLTFNSVTSTSTLTSFSYFKNLNFSTSTCIVNNSTTSPIFIAGVLSLNNSSGASTIYNGFYPFFMVTATLDSAKTLGGFGIDGAGITVSLARDTTVISTRQVTISRGTLTLNGFNLSTGAFVSGNTTVRSVAFGSNNITLTSTTAATTILAFATANNFTWTGTGGFIRDQAATATISFGSTSGASSSNAPNLTVNAGASALTVTNASWFKNLNFTGSTCTVAGVAGANTTINIAGDLTLATGGTYTAVQPSFRGSSTVTTLAKTVADTTINAVAVILADAMTSTGTFTLTNGTLDLNGFSLSTTGFSIGFGTKNLTFNGGTIYLSSATTSAWLNSNPTGFTTTAGTGVGTISMTAATAKSFQGGGSTYNCTVNQGGAGDLTITGSNTFDNITNTVQPASILFAVGTTNTFNSFSLSGTSGNLITISTFAAAGTHTLSKASGTVSVSFCSISYSTATGGAIWQALTTNGNVDAGNNTGWIFSGGPILVLINELIYVSDQCSAIYTTSSIVNEQILLQDTLSSIYTTNPSLSESTSLADSLSVTYDGLVNYTDSVSLLASLSVTSAFLVVCTDSISLTDSLSAIYSTSVSLADTIQVSESLLASIFIPASINDAVGLSSDLSVSGIFYVVSQNSVNLVDSAVPITTMNVSSAETINMLAITSGRFPWDLIEDDTDSNWQVISTVPYIT